MSQRSGQGDGRDPRRYRPKRDCYPEVGGGRGVLPGEMDFGDYVTLPHFGRQLCATLFFLQGSNQCLAATGTHTLLLLFTSKGFDRYAPMMPPRRRRFSEWPYNGICYGGDFGGTLRQHESNFWWRHGSGNPNQHTL